MLRRELLRRTGAVACGLWQLSAVPALSQTSPRRRVLFFSKSAGFEHSACQRDGDKPAYNERVMTQLGQHHGFDVTCSKDGRIFDDGLDAYDAFFFYTTGDLTTPGTDKHPPMSAKGKERLLSAVAAGKGFLASHCGSDTFHSAGAPREEQQERDPYIAMLGGEFISHGPQQVARQVIGSATFPGLQGLGRGFDLNEEWYSLKNFQDDLHVILAQDTLGMEGKDYERPPYPSTWARRHGQGRVFYTSMGHREDVWDHPTFQQIMLGGLAWCFGDLDAEVPPNLKEFTPGAHVMPPA